MKLLSFVIILFLCLSACKPDVKKEVVANKETTNASSKDAKIGYPSLPQDRLKDVWDNGEMIDYIFHNLPFSMNQTEQNSIRTNLTYIDPTPVNSIPSGCKPFARQFYQVGGNITLEADIYFDDVCQFYIFWVDGKPQFANYMSDSGKNFFNQMVKQAMQARENAGE